MKRGVLQSTQDSSLLLVTVSVPVKAVHQSLSSSPLAAVRMACGTSRDSSEMATRSPNGVGKFIPFTDRKTMVSDISAPHPQFYSPQQTQEPDNRKQESGGSAFREPTLNPRQAVYSLQLYPNEGDIELSPDGTREADERLLPNRLLQQKPRDNLYLTMFLRESWHIRPTLGSAHGLVSLPYVVPVETARLPGAMVEPYCVPETTHFTHHFLSKSFLLNISYTIISQKTYFFTKIKIT